MMLSDRRVRPAAASLIAGAAERSEKVAEALALVDRGFGWLVLEVSVGKRHLQTVLAFPAFRRPRLPADAPGPAASVF
jgi:hypothetical protein